jgi:hypothetical protein
VSTTALDTAKNDLQTAYEDLARLSAEKIASETAVGADKELSRKQSKQQGKVKQTLEKYNADLEGEIESLRSDVARFTRKFQKIEGKKIKLDVALEAQSKICNDLDAKRKKFKVDWKDVSAKLREREAVHQASQGQFGFMQSQLQKAEALAHKHEEHALQLQARLDEASCRKSGYPESEAPSSQGRRFQSFQSPPPKGFAAGASPIRMDSLEAVNEKMVNILFHNAQSYEQIAITHLQIVQGEVAAFLEMNNLSYLNGILKEKHYDDWDSISALTGETLGTLIPDELHRKKFIALLALRKALPVFK